MLPHHAIRICRRQVPVPPEAEQLFAAQLACSRRQPPSDQHGSWDFLLACALTLEGRVLGGVHLDLGPIGGAGPLAKSRLAYLERTLVLPAYRRQGLATALLRRAAQAAAQAGCLYIRCSNNWDNPAERALLLRCGFALIDLDGENDEQPNYMAVRPLRNLS